MRAARGTFREAVIARAAALRDSRRAAVHLSAHMAATILLRHLGAGDELIEAAKNLLLAAVGEKTLGAAMRDLETRSRLAAERDARARAEVESLT